jgi:hypothetical protein
VFYNINYFTITDLMVIWHCIIEERDEIGLTHFQYLKNCVKLSL